MINATAAEIYADFQMMFNQLATVSNGYITAETGMSLVYPNAVAAALTAVVDKRDLLFRPMPWKFQPAAFVQTLDETDPHRVDGDRTEIET